VALSKYTLCKYVKVDGTWRYCKAAYHDNGKIKPDVVFVNVKQALLEKHAEGRYDMSHNDQWIDAGSLRVFGCSPSRHNVAAVPSLNSSAGHPP
jgi:hypothetical protein